MTLAQKIESARSKMHQAAAIHGLRSREALEASRELDELITPIQRRRLHYSKNTA
jgi:hypothetical protein